MSRDIAPIAMFFALALVGVATASSGPRCPGLADDPQSTTARRCELIHAGFEANHAGRYADADAAWEALAALDATDPAAPLYRVETALWRLVNDDGAAYNDEIVRDNAKQAIRLADARIARDDDDAVAIGMKGQALVHVARLDGMRGNYLKAGRQGEKGRQNLQRALELQPELDGSRYVLGLYGYYAGVMPGFVKWVSWLWFVPKGDSHMGLDALQRVAAGDSDHAVDARFILMNIRTYHAPTDLAFALETGRSLHARYPDNALFHSELVEVLLLSGLYDEAITTAQALEDSHPVSPEAQARPQLARILRAQGLLLSGNADEAWAVLEPMDEQAVRLPIWGGAWLHLVRAQIHDARGEREQAVAEYQLVKGRKEGRYNRRAALIAEAGLVTPFEPSAYRELPMISAAPE